MEKLYSILYLGLCRFKERYSYEDVFYWIMFVKDLHDFLDRNCLLSCTNGQSFFLLIFIYLYINQNKKL